MGKLIMSPKVLDDLNDLREKTEKWNGKYEVADYMTSLSQLITYISSSATNDRIVVSTNADVSTALSNYTQTYGCMVLIFKASTNNAYYYAFNRNFTAYGNISLANGTVSICHPINKIDITSTITPAEGVTITQGGVYRQGDLIQVQLLIKATADIAVSGTLFTGFPTNANSIASSTVVVNRGVGNERDLSVYLTGSTLKLSSATYNTEGGLSNGKTLYLTFSYMV